MGSFLHSAVIALALVACSSPTSNRAPTGGSLRSSTSLQENSGPTNTNPPDTGIKRTLIAHQDLEKMPGFESRLYLIEYPPGARGNLHVHPEQCAGYVIEGRFESAFGTDAVTVTHAGEGFIDLPKQPHRFRNPDRSKPLRFVVAGSFRKEEPLFSPLPGDGDFSPSQLPADGSANHASSTGSAPGTVTEIQRTLLARKEIADLPGMESRIYLVEFPPGAESKLHIHPNQGIGYVLEGRFESKFGDGPVTTKRTGEGFIDWTGQVHRFKNPDSSQPLRFVVAGTFGKEDPLFQVVSE